ncbi:MULTISPECIES: hypothetical protein [unclassified Sinorhizobium]|uniref:hypothetical protein n=1 Tax=unclassified Sinorhizobium TaxID=2613772 RepID=UPI0024C4189F|nr:MULTISPECIES: hypothetical protein [unclassified Sinorhizobium]MDK1376268.1 hypothetical protein [Sinorhizobium sp. 6-70]MDK1482172.1 hypothetical protein [Sinorhizobium sp. 6-117]
MSRKVNEDKLQKLALLLGQTVAALRVNEMIMCRLLEWAASQSHDPRGFVRDAVETTRNDLQKAGQADGRMLTVLAAHEALEYLDQLSAAMQVAPAAKPQAGANGLAFLEHVHFPAFAFTPDRLANGTSKPRRAK